MTWCKEDKEDSWCPVREQEEMGKNRNAGNSI